jgi:uncharacterized protein (TIGR00255 family)
MIKSMTGYGRAESAFEGKRLIIELKSLNHRFLEVFVRLPNALSLLELEIKKKIGDRMSRGRIEANIRLESEQGTFPEPELELNRPLVHRYHDIFVQIKQEFNLKDEITLAMLAGIKDAVLPAEKGVDLAETWHHLESALEEAIGSLTLMRKKEGESLYNDLTARAALISEIMEDIKSRAPQVIMEYQKRLADRIRELTSDIAVDEARLAQEVAIMAERSDITEEIVRFGSHMDQFQDMLKSDDPVGRKLDFLLQEMNREINTIGSKTGDIEISRSVVEVKSELSRLREQIQNIE